MGAFLEDQERYALARAERAARTGEPIEPSLTERQESAAAYAAELNARLDAADEPDDPLSEFVTPWRIRSLDVGIKRALRALIDRIGGVL